MKYKILGVVCLVLLIAIGAEVIFFLLPMIKGTTSGPPLPAVEQRPSVSTNITKDPVEHAYEGNNRVNTDLKAGTASGALNARLFDIMATLRRDLISSATVTLECEGVIEKIYTEPFDWLGTHYEAAFKMKDYTAFDCQYFDFTETNLKQMKLFQMVNGKQEKMNFKDLKVGDRIHYKNVADLTVLDEEGFDRIYDITYTKVE